MAWPYSTNCHAILPDIFEKLPTGILNPERETSLDEVLAALELPARRFQAELGTGGAAEVIDLSVNGVRVTLMPTVSSRAERSPDPRESASFLELAEQVFDRIRPDVLLTYGGHPASLELMRRARLRGIAVVFHLHNFGYNDRRAFGDVSAVIIPSEYSRRHHAWLLGLDDPVIPDPIPLDRLVAVDTEPKYATFINPQSAKGMAIFARIVVFNERRLDIPLLEGHSGRSRLNMPRWQRSVESPPHAAGHAVIPAGHRSVNQMRSRDRHRGLLG